MPTQVRKQKMMVVTPQGPRSKDCVYVDVIDSKEPPSKYTLEDGSILTLRQVIQEIWRVEGEYDHENNPLYVVKAAAIISVIPDPKFKRPTN